MHYPVVIQNPELVIGEKGCHDEVIRLVAAIRRVLLFFHLPHRRSSCRPVMTVGYIKGFDLSEGLFQEGNVLILLQCPDPVDNSIIRLEVINGTCPDSPCHHLIDGRMPHSLLLEIFTKQGVGTEIIADE